MSNNWLWWEPLPIIFMLRSLRLTIPLPCPPFPIIQQNQLNNWPKDPLGDLQAAIIVSGFILSVNSIPTHNRSLYIFSSNPIYGFIPLYCILYAQCRHLHYSVDATITEERKCIVFVRN
jgi:hypothetical protein